MVNVNKKVFGRPVQFSVPATLAECVTMCGSEDAALQLIVNQVLAHSTMGEVRADFLDSLEEATGVKRKTKVVGQKKDGSGPITQPDETEEEFYNRTVAEKNAEPNAYDSLLKDAVDANPFDPKPHERKPRAPRSPTKADIAMANAVIAAGPEKLAQVAGLLSTSLNRPVASDAASLATALMEDRLEEQKQLAAKSAAKFGVAVPA